MLVNKSAVLIEYLDIGFLQINHKLDRTKFKVYSLSNLSNEVLKIFTHENSINNNPRQSFVTITAYCLETFCKVYACANFFLLFILVTFLKRSLSIVLLFRCDKKQLQNIVFTHCKKKLRGIFFIVDCWIINSIHGTEKVRNSAFLVGKKFIANTNDFSFLKVLILETLCCQFTCENISSLNF